MATRLRDVVRCGDAPAAVTTAIDPHAEYADYVVRFSELHPDAQPMSFTAFDRVLGRWRQDYHEAWCNGDRATMRALERMLALSADR
jgi:uncharacterized short protein YbdD (DUF466 family)